MAAIKICMGSSCYVRGNKDNLSLIEDFLRENGLEERVGLVGSVCERRCAEGPTIAIDGKVYTKMDGAALLDVLRSHLEEWRQNPEDSIN